MKTLGTEIKRTCIHTLLWLGICAVITTGWECLEIVDYGEVQPRDVDTIVTALFAWSIYGHLRQWLHEIETKEGGGEG